MCPGVRSELNSYACSVISVTTDKGPDAYAVLIIVAHKRESLLVLLRKCRSADKEVRYYL